MQLWLSPRSSVQGCAQTTNRCFDYPGEIARSAPLGIFLITDLYHKTIVVINAFLCTISASLRQLCTRNTDIVFPHSGLVLTRRIARSLSVYNSKKRPRLLEDRRHSAKYQSFCYFSHIFLSYHPNEFRGFSNRKIYTHWNIRDFLYRSMICPLRSARTPLSPPSTPVFSHLD